MEYLLWFGNCCFFLLLLSVASCLALSEKNRANQTESINALTKLATTILLEKHFLSSYKENLVNTVCIHCLLFYSLLVTL